MPTDPLTMRKLEEGINVNRIRANAQGVEPLDAAAVAAFAPEAARAYGDNLSFMCWPVQY